MTSVDAAVISVSATNLRCLRGGRDLFALVTSTLRGGESLVLRGPNGAGKSSLIRQVAGLLPAGSGMLDVQARCALSDENLALDEGQTLAEALAFWARMDAAPATAVSDALAQMALTDLRDVPVRMLSTGQRKRAMLARVIASGAMLWLLDEPGNGLDEAALSLLGAAMAAHVTGGGAIIAASHFALPFAFTREIALTPAIEPEPIW